MKKKADATGRPNQRNRTRQDLLRATSRLMKQDTRPTFEEIAEAAMVSRATAYRYFPSLEALLLEASLDVNVPDPEDMFPGGQGGVDPLERLLKVDDVLHDIVTDNESAIRLMLIHLLERRVWGADDIDTPARQNRRVPLVEAALAPSRGQFKPAALDTLVKALAMIIGTEAIVVSKDVLQIDDADVRKVKRWAIKALVEAAKKPAA